MAQGPAEQGDWVDDGGQSLRRGGWHDGRVAEGRAGLVGRGGGDAERECEEFHEVGPQAYLWV